jgi:hypothetical protein
MPSAKHVIVTAIIAAIVVIGIFRSPARKLTGVA